MSVIVDTGVLHAQHDEDAARHESAQAAIRRVAEGAYGTPLVSDYIYDEAVTLTQARTGRHADAKLLSDHLLGRDGHDLFSLLFVDSEDFESAVDVFESYDDQSLSITDATTIALVDRHDIEQVLAFDDDFDGIVNRLDPADVN